MCRLKITTTDESSIILPKKCIFCRKDKFKSGTHARETLADCSKFRVDTRINDSALKHIRTSSAYEEAAKRVLLICSPGYKDLVSSEATYHGSCYRSFVKIMYKAKNSEESSGGPSDEDKKLDVIFEAVSEFCKEMIKHPRIDEFSSIRKLWASKPIN